ncbi:MAG: GDSL-type esterase/lipase family protein [Planctomycetota bacterium]
MMPDNQWESAIRGFEQRDQRVSLPDAPILFTGSSSIARWPKLQQSMPHWPVLNRGFGGSEITDLLHFMNRVILPYSPRGVIIYSGDNDLASDKRPEAVAGDAERLTDNIHETLPEVTITFFSVKYSPARKPLEQKFRALNHRLETLAQRRSRFDYLDVASCLLDDDGQPDESCFMPDGLHLTEEGYERWTRIVQAYLLAEYPPTPSPELSHRISP